MKTPIYLPSNAFGVIVFLLLALLSFIVALVVVCWLLSLVLAPWWVVAPTALFTALFTFVLMVKFKQP